jgi:hypothetical protein
MSSTNQFANSFYPLRQKPKTKKSKLTHDSTGCLPFDLSGVAQAKSEALPFGRSRGPALHSPKGDGGQALKNLY